MFHSAGRAFSSLVRRRLVLGVGLVGAALCTSMPVSAQDVPTYTFADGTVDGWVSFNGASTPIASNAEAFTGSCFSLLTTTSLVVLEGGDKELAGLTGIGSYALQFRVALPGGD